MMEITEENLRIHVKTYLRTSRIIDFIIRFLKVNIRLKETNNTIENGDIFAFNHFSRFETFVPQHLFLKKSKVFCRSIAAAELFREGVLPNFLSNLGAIPHNHPDIFNFIVKEINRGIKLVIFPEGAMIKDKNVIDESGMFSVYSRSKRKRRKPHTGVAVIALRAESYRFLYRQALLKEDANRKELYSRYFPLSDQKDKIPAYDRPTKIVPSTITFYPIRISDNFLKILAERTGKKSKRLAEEMAIEGNFVTRDTDMDIYLSAPIDVRKYFNFADEKLLNILYSLRFEPGVDASRNRSFLTKTFGWLYEKRIRVLAERLTNHCMKEIYFHVTINISHIASLIIFSHVLKKKIFYIEKSKFLILSYCIIKEIQKEKKLILHPQLKNPELYGSILDDKNEFLNQFLSTAQEQKLLTITDENLSFLPKLLAKHEFDTIRLENTPRVRYNEVQPIKPLRDTAKKIINNFNKYNENLIPDYLFDDDIKIYHQDKNKYSGSDYEELNQRETKTASGKPFFLKAHRLKGRKNGVLLIHGFPASPAEMKPLGEFLHHEGFTVYGVRLKGYGTSPYDLEQTPWEECIESVKHGYKILSMHCKKVTVLGFSLGAVIALDMVSQLRNNISGAVSISASIEVEGMDDLSFIFSAHLDRLVSLIPGVKSKFIDWKTESPEINYRSVPLQKIMDVRNYIEQVKVKIKTISTPLLVIQSTGDPIVKQHSAEFIYDSVLSGDKKIYWHDSDKHNIVTKDCLKVYKKILSFIKKL